MITKKTVAYNALIELSNTDIRYCIWKSIDRFDDGAKGRTDFDILFDQGQKQLLFDKLHSMGWHQLNAEPWRHYRHVYDFVYYDPNNLRFIHFHVHFKLVMGERLIKSLSLPFEKLYLTSAVDTEGIPNVLPELEFIVFIIRLCIKIRWTDYASAIRRFNRRMIFNDFESEYKHIRMRCTKIELERLLTNPTLCLLDRRTIIDAYDDLYSLNFVRRYHIRHSLSTYRNHGPIVRYFLYRYRTYQKRRFGIGKTLTKNGKSFAFCGPDGSGKTTLVNAVEKILKEHFKVGRYYMGGNLTSGDFPRWLYHFLLYFPFKVFRKLFRILRIVNASKGLERIYFGYDSYLMAKEKLNRYKRGNIAIKKGSLVLFERFPLFAGYGDGCSINQKAPLFQKQQKILQRLSLPDVIFVLQIGAEEAALRKDDHSASEVHSKVEEFNRYCNNHQNDPGVVILDGHAPVERNVDIVLKRITMEINHDY